MTLGTQRIGTILLAFGIVTLLLVGASGLPHMGMNKSMDEHGNMAMSDCYMPGMTALCSMTPLEHVASQQSMFTSIQTESLVLTLLLLVLFVASAAWMKQIHSPPARRGGTAFRRRSEYIPFATQLQELFSSGILNPKPF